MPRHVFKAMQDPDNFVVTFEYVDRKGKRTRRVASPIRSTEKGVFLALCLCREEPRQFRVDRCRNIRLTPAHEVLMPVPMVTVA